MRSKALIDRLIDDCDALSTQVRSLRSDASVDAIAPIRQAVETVRRELDELESQAGPDGDGSDDAAGEKGNGQEPRKSAYDLAKELGLIGMLKDAPEDLSTNKDYFEGFGRD